jgi:3-hydroxybutyryl-CoA dehydratase
MHCAASYSFQQIVENSEFSKLYRINETVYRALVEAFGDESPLHIDDEYARRSGFDRRVMHGAILQGFLSNFVGMHFPGKNSLILSVFLNYHQPSYLGDEIILTARVRQKTETGSAVVLELKFRNAAAGTLVASGKAQVMLRND